MKSDETIAGLRNLGPASAAILAEAGIRTAADLAEAGAAGAYVRLRFIHGRRISLTMLWALHGALAGIDWRHLSAQDKARLKREAGL